MKDLTFKVNENGKIINYNIIKYFKYKDKNYIIYNEENKDEIYASTYVIENNELILNKIDTDEEWDYIDLVLEDMDRNGNEK